MSKFQECLAIQRTQGDKNAVIAYAFVSPLPECSAIHMSYTNEPSSSQAKQGVAESVALLVI